MQIIGPGLLGANPYAYLHAHRGVLSSCWGCACLPQICWLTRVRGWAEVKLYWHPQGEFLAVQVDRYTKTRKSTYTSFELFSVRERDIPMEVGAALVSHPNQCTFPSRAWLCAHSQAHSAGPGRASWFVAWQQLQTAV